jgi:hypothetical protein
MIPSNMQWRIAVHHALQLRNSRTHHVASLLDEANNLRSELLAATVAKKALERQAVVTVLASGHGDISGLLGDTPLPPRLCTQLAVELQALLTRASNCDESSSQLDTDDIMMRDPVFRTCTENVIARFLLCDPQEYEPNLADTHAADSKGHADLKQHASTSPPPSELRVATLENAFAGLACEALLASRSIGGGDFDLPRMLRMLTAFRSMVADACYGSMTRQARQAPAAQTAKDESSAMTADPAEAVAARKARLAVTHEVRPRGPSREGGSALGGRAGGGRHSRRARG